MHGVRRPSIAVRQVTANAFEVHTERGRNSGNFVVWAGSEYTASGTPTATRAISNEIWDYITQTYDLVYDGSLAYNGFRDYDAAIEDRGQLGID